MTRRPRPAAGLALLALLSLAGVTARPSTALAWGRVGHRASGLLAEARLTPTARAAVAELLGPGQSLAEVSTWADEVRHDRPESAPWHYVNVPITEAKYAEKFCPEQGCVVRKIDDFRRTLADLGATREQRREALKFLVHFLQDMHNPVHVGDRSDRGGNDTQVQFFDKGSNLHRVWDSGLVEHAFPDEQALLVDLKAKADAPEAAGWVGGAVVDWANESLDDARRAYQVPGTDRLLRSGSKLGEEYQKANLPVAEKRLAQSAVRLAAVLNSVFPGPPQ